MSSLPKFSMPSGVAPGAPGASGGQVLGGNQLPHGVGGNAQKYGGKRGHGRSKHSKSKKGGRKSHKSRKGGKSRKSRK